MTGVSIDSIDEHLPDVRDESGTAPGDRRFRPDVEGLRAVAIVLVVLYHGSLEALSGGYVGVDVFFVISGFVITGLLLRERTSSTRTSFLSFYGRRSRRIIPAATLVIVVTVIATYAVLGAIYGNPTAVDARWTAVFLANFHFTATGTNYLTAQEPPSPLLNFWSLAVEEQFYLVYPAFFAFLALLRGRVSLQAKLAVGLTVVIVISFVISAAQTNTSATAAYFSPFARAWELALGALIAVGTSWLLRIPKFAAGIMTWVGLGAIGSSAVVFGANTSYPGTAVAVPVLGAGLVIAGGIAAPRWAAESLLGLRPFRWMGRLSYSLYLWHWPILIIAAESLGKAHLSFSQNVVWLFVAVGASVVSYRFVENPMRHARILARGWVPIAVGALLITLSVVVATIELNSHSGRDDSPIAVRTAEKEIIPASPSQLHQLLESAPKLRFLPSDLTPSLTQADNDWGGPPSRCWPGPQQTSIPDSCVFGNPRGSKTMVVYGDSHAGMWFDALDSIAKRDDWRLIDLSKGACPANTLPYEDLLGGAPGRLNVACNQWHTFAVRRIRQLDPDLLVITQEYAKGVNARNFTAQQWQKGLRTTLNQLRVPTTQVVVLGNIPLLPWSAPQCLARSSSNIQACSVSPETVLTKYNEAESVAAHASGARYVNVTSWFCSKTCTTVVGKYEVYDGQYHVTADYSIVLEQVLQQALQLPADT